LHAPLPKVKLRISSPPATEPAREPGCREMVEVTSVLANTAASFIRRGLVGCSAAGRFLSTWVFTFSAMRARTASSALSSRAEGTPARFTISSTRRSATTLPSVRPPAKGPARSQTPLAS
jgi:hypothetical protein